MPYAPKWEQQENKRARIYQKWSITAVLPKIKLVMAAFRGEKT
jgi:hypothetical protein